MSDADDLQIRIMGELVSPGSLRWNVRESYRSMAERLGVDEETVRRGVKRAADQGFLRGWRLVLNPHLIGWESAGIQVEVDNEERKPEAISQIRLVEGVVIIVVFRGKPLRVVFYHQNEQALARQVKLISSICGSKELVQWMGGFPACDMKVRNTDWQIMKALRREPRRLLSEVASEVGASTKTIKRRLTLMTQSNAFYLLPSLNYDKYPGVACDLLISCPDDTRKRTVDKILRSKLKGVVFSFTEARGFSIFAMVSPNISEADETHLWIKGLDGVKDVRMDIMRENMLVDEWLDEEVEKHLSQNLQLSR